MNKLNTEYKKIVYKKQEPQNYQAYVYEYFITETNMKYIGSHVGRFDETYQHSCKNVQFLTDLANSKNIIITLINFGTKFDMVNLEHELLKAVDAKNNPNYYNRSNGGGKGVTSVFDIDELHQKTDEIEIKKKPCSELIKLNRLQVRVENDSLHIKQIKNRIDADYGNTENYLIHIFEEYDNGKDMIANGSHTILAASQSKYSTAAVFDVKYIPKIEWSKYNDAQLRLFAMDLNPKEKYVRKSNQREDWAKWLHTQNISNSDFDINSKKIREELQKPPRNLTPYEIGKVRDLAKEMNKEHEANINGKKIKKYEKEELQNLVKKHQNKTKVSFAVSTGNAKDIINTVIEYGLKYEKTKIRTMMILLYNNSYKNYENWIKKCIKVKEKTDYLQEKMEWTILFEVLPTWESDKSNTE